ncbi:hypothetical protein HKX48_002266, partial [Thoreauomyces humboldtii]
MTATSKSTEWKVEPVRLSDAEAIARTNMSAFWNKPSWRRSWNDDITLSYLIEQVTLKLPDDLLYRRDILRHFKAVDPATGRLVGYMRVGLPKEHVTLPDGTTPVWSDVQTPDVEDAEERERIGGVAERAWYKPNDDGAEDEAFAMQARIL